MLFTDTDSINEIINHPSVREFALFGRDEDFDVRPLIESGTAIFLGDKNGGFLFVNKGSGVYEVHTQFLPHARGPRVAIAAVHAARIMFTQTDCEVLTTFVAHGNRAAKELALAVGFRKLRDETVMGNDGETFAFGVKEWARSLCQQQQ